MVIEAVAAQWSEMISEIGVDGVAVRSQLTIVQGHSVHIIVSRLAWSQFSSKNISSIINNRNNLRGTVKDFGL